MSSNMDFSMMKSYFGLGISNPTALFSSLGQTSGTSSLLLTKSGMQLQSSMMKYLQGSDTSLERYEQAVTDYANTAKPFYNGYYSKMEDLQNSARELKSTSLNSAIKPTGYGSDNSKVASVVSGNLEGGADVSIKVNQTAAAQKVTYNGLASKTKGSLGGSSSLTMTTATGTKKLDFNISYNSTNAEALQSIASQVNAAKMGVTAAVVDKNGVSSLQFQSDKTGQEQSFEISMTGKAGNVLTSSTKIDAQDAVYEIDGHTYTSASNQVKIEGDKNTSLTVQLNGAGTAGLSRGNLDTGSAVKAMKQLASDYNKVVDYLNDNASLSSAIRSQAFSFSSLRYGSSNLSKMGINVDGKGKLSINEEAFTKALQEDPAKVQKMIGGANGLAGSIYNKTVDAINSARDLLKVPTRYGNYYGQSTGSLLNLFG